MLNKRCDAQAVSSKDELMLSIPATTTMAAQLSAECGLGYSPVSWSCEKAQGDHRAPGLSDEGAGGAED